MMCYSAYAQNRNSIWCFGDSAGIDFRDTANPVPFSSGVTSRSDCASIADENGNLLFYVGGDSITGFFGGRAYNRNHEVMPSSLALAGGNWNHEMLIVPMPGDPEKYYIFHSSATGLIGSYYSVVDMSLDNGNGDVLLRNQFLSPNAVMDGISAVKHANGRDWWVFYACGNLNPFDNKFYRLLITPSGISPLDSIYLGEPFATNAGEIIFSEDGEKMMFSIISGLIEVADFDRCAGTFSNLIVVEPDSPATRAIMSTAFSPNKNLIYVSSNDYVSHVFQYDLRAIPVKSSKDTLATFSTYHNISGQLRLAPDHKIYLSNIYYNSIGEYYPYADSMYNPYNMNLSVIHSPDNPGASCNFQSYAFYLGGHRTYLGLPNNTNYGLGPVSGSVCDSLIGVEEIAKKKFFSIHPNPCSGNMTLRVADVSNEKIEIEIFNEWGQVVVSREAFMEDQQFDLSFLPKGIYMIRLKGVRFTEAQRLIRF